MKAYEKPRLIALSLQGNERLCGDCSDKGYQTVVGLDPSTIKLWGLSTGNLDGELTRAEFDQIFASSADCTELVVYGSYCKFSSSSENMIAWS